MRVPQTPLQKIKTAVHFTQALCIFVAGCLDLAVMTSKGGLGGGTDFLFGLCFLTIPALIYQVMVPAWTRAWRFVNVYAYVAIDLLFTVLWLAAAIAVGVWTNNGISKGSAGSDQDNTKDKGKGCGNFAYGSETKCNVSKASVGFGVLVFVLFATTSGISIYGIIQYKRTGVMPNENNPRQDLSGRSGGEEDPNKDPWSMSTDELDPLRHNSAASTDARVLYGQDTEEDERGLLHGHQPTNDFRESQTEDNMAHPGARLSYHSLSTPKVEDEDDLTSSALSPTNYIQSPDGRVQFPPANYQRL